MNTFSRPTLPQALATIVMLLICAHDATSQMVEPRKHDYSRMARPWLSEKFQAEREKRDWDRYVLGGPINHDNGIFLNRNAIVETSAQTFPQNESSIAISPIDPKYLIASAVDSRVGAWVYFSRDGGVTWENQSFGVVRQNWQSGNDPSVGFDHEGNPYVMYGAFPQPFTGESGVYIARSFDTGRTWQPHIVVIEHTGAMTADSAFEDKYYIEIDRSASSPYRGWMYTPWKRVTDRDSATQIVFTRSIDGGTTWTTPIGIGPRKSGTSRHITFGQSFPLVRTGPNGEIYGVWNDGPARSIGFVKSIDGGDTWTEPRYPVTGYEYLGTDRYFTEVLTVIDTIDRGEPTERYDTTQVTDTVNQYHVLKNTFRAETYPTMAVDMSQGERRGWIYLCWSANRNPDIYEIHSSDGGETWSAPKIIQSETRNDQWWPWISIDETNGDIGVMYSDSRNDPDNILIDTYVSYSSDGGATWIDRKATDAMSDFRDNPFIDQVFAGDYSGNAFHDGKIYPSFLDTRNDNDVYIALVDIRKPLPVENLRVGTRLDDLTEARLSWTNPPLETAFGLPIDDYTLVIEKNGQLLTTLPSGSTSRIDPGIPNGSTVTYTVRVVVDGDTSVARTVEFESGGARLPGTPEIVTFAPFQEQLDLTVKLPSTRADSVTPLTNLAGFRLYRDGVAVRTITAESGDTATLETVNDNPPRGYYEYAVATIDSDGNESAKTSPVVIYVGGLEEYDLRFEQETPLLTSGRWDRTDAIASEGTWSLTDSPTGGYTSRASTSAQLYPVATGYNVITFDQIVVVKPDDSALVEYSIDSGRTWIIGQHFTQSNSDSWADGTADPGDWQTHMVIVDEPTDMVIFRFRLASGIFNNADGWYIDNVTVGVFIDAVEEEDHSDLAISVVPNPLSRAGAINVNLTTPERLEIRLYDVIGREIAMPWSGQRMYEAGRHPLPLRVETLTPGSYIWTAVSAEGMRTGRFIVGPQSR